MSSAYSRAGLQAPQQQPVSYYHTNLPAASALWGHLRAAQGIAHAPTGGTAVGLVYKSHPYDEWNRVMCDPLNYGSHVRFAAVVNLPF
jgi:hypothetical protein